MTEGGVLLIMRCGDASYYCACWRCCCNCCWNANACCCYFWCGLYHRCITATAALILVWCTNSDAGFVHCDSITTNTTDSKCGVIAKLVNICFIMDYMYDTVIALFTVKFGPLYRLMSVVVDLWEHLIVLVDDFVYAGTFWRWSCCGAVLVCVVVF